MKKIYLLSFSVLFLTIQPSFADINAANDALARGDHAAAAEEFHKLAKQGDKKAQAHLGYMYYVGEGVEQDYVQAVKWYKKAAILGDKDSQYNLAVAYAFGEGAKQDYKEAFHWYRRAAEQNHIVAQYSIGISYAYGEGIAQNPELAAEWFTKSADQGYERAQVLLGSLYHTGEGVEKNYQKAAFWYRKAADRGNPAAQYNLGTLYRAGHGVKQDYNQAVRWFRLSADQGYAAAQNELASMERAIAGANRPAPVAVPEIETAPVQAKTDLAENVEETTDSIPTLSKSEPASAETISSEPASIESEIATEEERAPVVEPDAEMAVAEAAAEEKPKRGFFSRLFGKKDTSDSAPDQSGVVYATPEEIAAAESIYVPVPDAEIEEAEQIISPDMVSTKPAPTDSEIAVVEELPFTEEAVEQATVTELAVEEKPKKGFFSRLFGKKDASDSAPDQSGVVYATPEEIAAAESTYVPVPDVPDTETEEAEDIVSPELASPEPALTDSAIVAVEEQVPAAEPIEEITVVEVAVEEKPKKGFFSILFGKKDASDSAPDQSGVVYATPEEIAAAESIYVPVPYVPDTETEEADDIVSPELASPEPALTDFAIVAVEEQVPAAEPIEEITVVEVAVEEKPKKGFFSILFGKKDAPEEQVIEDSQAPEVVEESLDEPSKIITYAADSAPVGQQLETSHESEITESQNESDAAAGQPPADISSGDITLAEPDSTDEDEVETKIEEISESEAPKRGFFSRLFGTSESEKNKPGENADAAETIEIDESDEAIVIAKLEEPDLDEIRQREFEEAFIDSIEVAPDLEDISSASDLQPLAVKGDSNAQFQLGALFYRGKGVQRDYTQAFLWYRRAAQQGNSDAQYSLGNMYLMGEGIKQDDYQARQWYEKAAEQGHEGAQHNLESLQRIATAEPEPESDYDQKDNLLPDQNEDDTQEESLHEETGDERGFFSKLFGKDDDEEDESIDTDEEVEETELSNDQISVDNTESTRDSAKSIYEKGLAHEFGEGVVQSYSIAFEYFKKSAEQNHAPAQYKMGLAYAYGQGTEKDPVAAAEWYQKSAKQGYALAQRTLGTLYMGGDGVEQNKPLALAWYDILADSGNVMDIHRRDSLKEKLTPDEIDEANKLKRELSN